MDLEIATDKKNISKEEIKEFQKNLTEYVQSLIEVNDREIEENMHDYYPKSLNERINEYLIDLEQSGESLHVSTRDQEYFLAAMGEYNDNMGQ